MSSLARGLADSPSRVLVVSVARACVVGAGAPGNAGGVSRSDTHGWVRPCVSDGHSAGGGRGGACAAETSSESGGA